MSVQDVCAAWTLTFYLGLGRAFGRMVGVVLEMFGLGTMRKLPGMVRLERFSPPSLHQMLSRLKQAMVGASGVP